MEQLASGLSKQTLSSSRRAVGREILIMQCSRGKTHGPSRVQPCPPFPGTHPPVLSGSRFQPGPAGLLPGSVKLQLEKDGSSAFCFSLLPIPPTFFFSFLSSFLSLYFPLSLSSPSLPPFFPLPIFFPSSVGSCKDVHPPAARSSPQEKACMRA